MFIFCYIYRRKNAVIGNIKPAPFVWWYDAGLMPQVILSVPS